MKSWWASLGLWGAALAGAGTWGYGLTQQTAIEVQMNQTLQTISRAIAQTSNSAMQTSVALQPLVATSQALSGAELLQRSTAAHITHMNHTLVHVASIEQVIVSQLEALNSATLGVGGQLSKIVFLNSQLLTSSQTSVQQVQQVNNNLDHIGTLTAQSIDHLHHLNARFAAFKILP